MHWNLYLLTPKKQRSNFDLRWPQSRDLEVKWPKKVDVINRCVSTNWTQWDHPHRFTSFLWEGISKKKRMWPYITLNDLAQRSPCTKVTNESAPGPLPLAWDMIIVTFKDGYLVNEEYIAVLTNCRWRKLPHHSGLVWSETRHSGLIWSETRHSGLVWSWDKGHRPQAIGISANKLLGKVCNCSELGKREFRYNLSHLRELFAKKSRVFIQSPHSASATAKIDN